MQLVLVCPAICHSVIILIALKTCTILKVYVTKKLLTNYIFRRKPLTTLPNSFSLLHCLPLPSLPPSPPSLSSPLSSLLLFSFPFLYSSILSLPSSSLPLSPLPLRGYSTPSEGHCRCLLCPSLLRTVCPLLAAWCPGVCMYDVMKTLPKSLGPDLALPRPQTAKGIIWS